MLFRSTLEELESRLLGLRNELDEIEKRDSEAVILQMKDDEVVLRVEAIDPPDEGKKPVDDQGFKGLDGEKAVADRGFEFKIEKLSSNTDDEEDTVSVGDSVGEGESTSEYIEDQDLFRAVARLVVEERVATTSFIQRRFGIGYAKAARIVDKLEELAIVSPIDGNNPRRVLASPEKLEKILASL